MSTNPRNEKHTILNEGDDYEIELFGYRTQIQRHILCILGYIFSLGFLRLLFYWKPQLDVWCNCIPCSLEEAEIVLLRTTDEDKKYSKKKVKFISCSLSHVKPDDEGFPSEKFVNKLIMNPPFKLRYIKVQKTRYIWNSADGVFQKAGVLEDNLSCSDIHTKFAAGLSREEQDIGHQICGPNTIEVEITPIWKLLFKEVLNPMFFFEVYAICIWLIVGYVEYTMALIVMTIVSIFTSIYMLRKQSIKLNRMVESHNNVMITVLHKNGVMEEMQSRYLIPGDVIILTGKKLYLPCDLILISGGCVINESMLTGESIPVTKTPLPNVDNSIPWKVHTGENYKGHMLFCGTEVIKTKPASDGLVKAIVLHTGFNSTKGDLVRSILYPKPVHNKLFQNVFWVFSGLIGISFIVTVCMTTFQYQKGATTSELVILVLLMMTCAVPVNLPPSLTICSLYSQKRLKNKGIFCISPQRLSLCGQVNLFCFDKTGTLTEEGLDLWGIVPSGENGFQEVHDFTSGCTLPWGPLLGAIASCHSLNLLDGKTHGDPMDLRMFEGSGWELEERRTNGKVDENSGTCVFVKPRSRGQLAAVKGLYILHQFPFSSSLQRMSVVTQVLGERRLTVFLKGAPEMVITFCKQETVPSSFTNTLEYYTMQGFRVIGLAYKHLELNEHCQIEKIKREEVESNLLFLGLLVMGNQLKPETKPVVQELISANIRTVILTGDNLQTACTVGINCGMVPEDSRLNLIEASNPENGLPASMHWQLVKRNKDNGIKQNKTEINLECITEEIYCDNNMAINKYYYAMTGETYKTIKQHFPRMVPDILLNGTIFARMAPKQKLEIIQDFQQIGYCVGMCGDGANDCQALKMAHVGISLSELEASVASPFTSKITNIECVSKVLKEGRNVLVTSISFFKCLIIILINALTCMFFVTLKNTLFGTYQYLLVDLLILLPTTLTLSLNGPAPVLCPYKPSGNLFSPALLPSLFIHAGLSIILQSTAFCLVQQQPWYNETDVLSACIPQNQSFVNRTTNLEPTYSQNFISSTLSFVVAINLITLEFVFSKGRPHRQPIYKNYLLSVIMTIQLGVYLFLMFADIESVYSVMELVCMPYDWRGKMLLMMLVHFAVSNFVEEGILENRKLWLAMKTLFKYKSKSQYKKLQRKLEKRMECVVEKEMAYARPSYSVAGSGTSV